MGRSCRIDSIVRQHGAGPRPTLFLAFLEAKQDLGYQKQDGCYADGAPDPVNESMAPPSRGGNFGETGVLFQLWIQVRGPMGQGAGFQGCCSSYRVATIEARLDIHEPPAQRVVGVHSACTYVVEARGVSNPRTLAIAVSAALFGRERVRLEDAY